MLDENNANIERTRVSDVEVDGKGSVDRASLGVDLETETTDTMNMKNTGEGEGLSIDETKCTQRQYPSLFPDLFPIESRSGQAREECTMQSEPSTLRSSEALVARGGETAAGQSDGGGDSDMWSDTGSMASEESEGGQAFAENVEKIANRAKDSPAMRRKLKSKNRNKTFKKVVLDRRYRPVPRLLLRSCDLTITCDTGTGETFYFPDNPESRTFYEREFLEREFREWPAIDQEGEYKDLIGRTMSHMKRVMAQVRELI